MQRRFPTLLNKDRGFISRVTKSYTEDIAKGGRRAARWIQRTTPNTPGTSRQAVRKRLYAQCFKDVTKQSQSMPRSERRNLARAYAKGFWKDRQAATVEV